MGTAPRHPAGVDGDLVEYLVVALPDLDAVTMAVPAMFRLEESGVVTILDWLVVERDADGVVEVLTTESVLDDDDVAVAAATLPPGSFGLIVVAEDRWARPFADGVASVGGRIVAGERIPTDRRRPPVASWMPPLIDVVDQLEELAGLLARGLVSDEEFDSQKRKVLARRTYGVR